MFETESVAIPAATIAVAAGCYGPVGLCVGQGSPLLSGEVVQELLPFDFLGLRRIHVGESVPDFAPQVNSGQAQSVIA